VVIVWVAFVGFVLILLAVDLGVLHKKARVVSVREALGWTAVWVSLALVFALFVYAAYEHRWLGLGTRPDIIDESAAFPHGRVNDGAAAVVKFVTAYVVEESLSVDNVFVIAMLFRYFRIPARYQHRVLFWGILGAIAMRGMMIAFGTRLIAQFAWTLYLFGGILLVTAVRMLFMGDDDERDFSRSVVYRALRKLVPLTETIAGDRLLLRDSRPGSSRFGFALTPLGVALVMIETTDLVFAVDSIPAVFAITADPFLVFTSNVFAILGLRSLYFALAGALHAFHYLKHALAVVLAMVGTKMLAHTWLEEILGASFNLYLLGAVLLVLATGVGASLLSRRWEPPGQAQRIE
jgi:tellurite resistance protein TerC